MEQPDIKIKGVWKHFCRTVDIQGKTVDSLLKAKRDMSAAKRFLDKALEGIISNIQSLL